jgi:predicted kinase
VRWPVICDAVFDRRADRQALEGVAAAAGVPFHGFWLDAPEDALASRISARAGDPSDATVDVMRAQQAKLAGTGPVEWTRLDASHPPEETAQRMCAVFPA